MTQAPGIGPSTSLSDAAGQIQNLIDANTEWQQQAEAKEKEQILAEETEAASAQQYEAELADPRNKESWGVGGVVKELQSAFMGGVQDTASSIVTLPERGLDIITGEMQEEMKTDDGYTAEWDDFFVDDRNPIETKTWWGGLIRSATHFGTMAAAITGAVAAAAPSAAAAGTAAGIGGVVRAGAAIWGNTWARAAAVGAASDLASKYSQDANALQILRDRYGFIDTPLTTNDTDHPVVMTLKNVVEGMGIGEIANGIFRIIGKGAKRIRLGPAGEEIVEDLSEQAVAKGDARAASVDEQIIEKGQLELFESGTDFRGHKNKPLADPGQGSPTSKDNPVDVRDRQRRTRTEWGAEEGSPGSVTTPVQLEVAARTSGLSEDVLTQIFRDLVSEPRFNAEIEAIRAGRTTMSEKWGDAIEQFQRTGLGREAADQSPEDYLAEYFEGAHRYFEDTPDEMVAWSSKNVVAGDLLIGSLVREIRDLGLVGRELADITDLGDVDGAAHTLFDKLLTVTTEVKRSRIIQSDEFRGLGAGANRQQFVAEALQSQVDESIDAYRLALRVAGESENDDLFKAIFETVSMTKEIENINDFDNWIRKKLKGGDFNGQKRTGLAIRELEKVMVHSILSGPKTPMRAIMGTGSAAFLRPISTAVGAAIRFPFTGDGDTLRAALASTNAMMQTLPEAFTLFKTRLNSYWAGDIATVKSRYAEYTKGDEQWEMFGHWIENSPNATLGDKAAYNIANVARWANDNKYLTYSTKIMAATDDTFGYILARAKAREKAVREALDGFNKGQFTEITPDVIKASEDNFLSQILDADGNIRIDTEVGQNVRYAQKEATLTTDLKGFSKGLNQVFDATPWAKPFFLFARTGVNGLELTAKHTPGLNFLVQEFNDIAWANVDDLSNVTKYGINNATDLINAKRLQEGRLAIGTGVIMMAGHHFLNGGLTGNGPTDRQKRQVWIDAGYVPRSIKIGNTWVSYDAFEPFNQILATLADVGDHSQLMGDEWTENQFQKLSLVIAQGAASKSYLQGIQQFVDLFAGRPGQQNRIIAGLMNNVVPMAGLRNELGKLFNPHMKELGSGIGDAIRNRNLISEHLSVDPISTKYDMLNGQPIRDHDFPTRMFQMFWPVQLNLYQGPGRKLLFDSGYDIRMSTYYGPDGTDLSDSPRLRSLFQQYIGMERLERKLNKLAEDPRVQASIEQMNHDLRNGNRDLDPQKYYLHNKLIHNLFRKAKLKAWAKMRQTKEVQDLIAEAKELEIRGKQRLKQTSEYDELLQLNK